MTTFKLKELGCKVNQYESQVMRERLMSAGFTEANGSPADIYVINTCTVTASADSDSRKLIRRALKESPKAKIVVTGCYVEKDADDIRNICPDAIILKNNLKENIMGAIAETPHCGVSALRNDGSIAGISNFAGHNRAFVKIEDGCDNHCSYCKVPFVRGRPTSRDPEDILKEANRLTERGFKEVVLCGICLGAYDNLLGLLDRLEEIEGLKRLRLSSIEPGYVNNKLIDRISRSEKLCRHLHIPLQSGDDDILKSMNRRYTVRQYLNIVDYIRQKMPGIALSTDVLVGFPGETGREFENTLKTLKGIKPMRTHVFSFSKREGTGAFYMPGEVDKNEISRRLNAVRDLAKELSFSYRKNFEGRVVRVLVENTRDTKTGLLTGYTDTYIKILLKGQDSIVNELVKVRITEVLSDYTIGQVQ